MTLQANDILGSAPRPTCPTFSLLVTEFLLVIDDAARKRVAGRCGLDLADLSDDLDELINTVADPARCCRLLYALVQPQAERHGIGELTFVIELQSQPVLLARARDALVMALKPTTDEARKDRALAWRAKRDQFGQAMSHYRA